MTYMYSIKTLLGNKFAYASVEAPTAQQLREEILALPNCILNAVSNPKNLKSSSWYRLVDDDGRIMTIDEKDFWSLFEKEKENEAQNESTN